MAKKMNAKERREAANAEKSKKIQQAEAARKKQKKDALAKSIRDAELKKFRLDQETRSKLPKNNRKSLAKAAGLKSTFAVGDTLYMTSFGKGNDAIVEKKIYGNQVTHLSSEKETFTVNSDSITDTVVPVQSKRIAFLTSQADNPLYRKDSENKVQPDKLLLKDTLEKNYFGKTFNDTLHIQLIYNILDIQKILTVYSVNTVYSLNNLFGEENSECGDIIGKLSYMITLDDFYNQTDKKGNFINRKLFDKFYTLPSLGYYGHIFFKDNKKRSKQEVYNIIALIATIRQWCLHFEEDKKTWIYNAEKVLSQEHKDILDDIYGSLVKKINRNFIKDNKVNLVILSDILNMKTDDKFNELIRQYYRFIVTKEQKLLGFSIKKLREAMLKETVYKEDKKYDSIRSKMYKLIDFILFYKYTTDDSEKEYAISMIEKLRASVSSETKENIYKEESERIWKLYENVIKYKIEPMLDESSISTIQKDKSYDDMNIEGIVVNETANVSYFSKIIYLLAQFIDGKEVNDLTTTLINKFDNIRSFIETANQIGLDCTFLNEYKFFDTADTVKNELHVIKNLAGMGYYDKSVKRQMYKDAIDILGIEDNISDEEIYRLIDDTILFLDTDGKPLKMPKGKKGFRNFIISNVLNSSRFRYLVKYCNPKKIRKIANNEKIVRFVLGRISDTQIQRYYLSCNPEMKKGEYPGHDEAINDLTKIIINMRYDDFKDVKQKANVSDKSKEAQEKMKYQTIISLYLTVCYHLVKNLVNINARYAMAFHSFERDARFYGIQKDHEKLMENQSVLVEKLLTDSPETAGNLHLRSKKWHRITQENLENYSATASQHFRNVVAHLNPIRNADTLIKDIGEVTSYYGIYHYIIQKSVLNRIPKDKKTDKLMAYEECINKHHSYNKDFVKALCVPLAYNIVRFKALTVYELFDRNYQEEKKAEET
jgi:hypothetical protein